MKMVRGGPSGMADVLFVVDNSGSMSQHQQNLAAHIPLLVKALLASGVDFHAAVTTTDMDPRGQRGRFVGPVVTSATPDAETALSNQMLVGTSGSVEEMMFDPVMAALSEPLLSGANAGFLRDGAGLTVIFLTDADDQSHSASWESFVQFLRGLKPDPATVSAQGILANDVNCPKDGTADPVKISAAIAELGGKAYSLCAVNFADNVREIARSITTLNKSTGGIYPESPLTDVKLPLTPKFDTISVNFGTQELSKGDPDKGWRYDWVTNAIVFGKNIVWTAQPEGTPLTITFVPTTF